MTASCAGPSGRDCVAPQVLVVMGVSGCGKRYAHAGGRLQKPQVAHPSSRHLGNPPATACPGAPRSTVASLVARQLGLPFYEGDTYHPPSNIGAPRGGGSAGRSC